jgi:hypothetical protein
MSSTLRFVVGLLPFLLYKNHNTIANERIGIRALMSACIEGGEGCRYMIKIMPTEHEEIIVMIIVTVAGFLFTTKK